jgi:hypothetical protein
VLVLTAAGTGLAVVQANYFRRGTMLFGLAVCLGALLRLSLTDEQAGLLKVRSKTTDVPCMLVLGVSTLVLAVLVPAPS